MKYRKGIIKENIGKLKYFCWVLKATLLDLKIFFLTFEIKFWKNRIF